MEILEEIIEAFPEFLTDEPVNGGDLVEFIGNMIHRYEENRPKPVNIRFLIDTVSSLTDIYGNRYHYATITSTKTGKALKIKSLGGESNARALVRNLTNADWSEIHSTESDLKIREFNRARKYHSENAKYEHDITAADFEALELI